MHAYIKKCHISLQQRKQGRVGAMMGIDWQGAQKEESWAAVWATKQQKFKEVEAKDKETREAVATILATQVAILFGHGVKSVFNILFLICFYVDFKLIELLRYPG